MGATSIAGIVCFIMAIALMVSGVALLGASEEKDRLEKMVNNWRDDGRLVVFQKKGEPEGEASWRLKCQGGVVVDRELRPHPYTPCDTK